MTFFSVALFNSSICVVLFGYSSAWTSAGDYQLGGRLDAPRTEQGMPTYRRSGGTGRPTTTPHPVGFTIRSTSVIGEPRRLDSGRNYQVRTVGLLVDG